VASAAGGEGLIVSIPYGFRHPRDLYEKLKRDAARLEEISPDNLFNFMITAWALIDGSSRALRKQRR